MLRILTYVYFVLLFNVLLQINFIFTLFLAHLACIAAIGHIFTLYFHFLGSKSFFLRLLFGNSFFFFNVEIFLFLIQDSWPEQLIDGFGLLLMLRFYDEFDDTDLAGVFIWLVAVKLIILAKENEGCTPQEDNLLPSF